MIKLVAFDWNGTLIADMRAIFEADNQVLKMLNQKPVSYHDFLDYFEVPVKNYYFALGVPKELVEENLDKMMRVFLDYYESRAANVRSRSNAKTILKWLKVQKIPAIVISNHFKEKIITHLTRLNLARYFEEVIGNFKGKSAMKEKNKKERLEKYMKVKNIRPQDTLIVGDTTEEVEIAKELGALSVALTHGNSSTSRLKAAKPDYLISDLGNLISIIREINAA